MNALQRTLGLFQVNAIGLGCMSLSHAYGTTPNKDAASHLLNHALDVGYNLLDTAALYGFGANEELLGSALKGRRHQFVLASKCGLFRNADGVREINGRPDVIKKTCEDSLRRLNTEVIDLYYLHRWDKNVPIEDSVGALSDLVQEGKIRSIGLSEVSVDTLKKAHNVHPVTAVQNEFSLWTRNPHIAMLEACRTMGIALVAFSPVGRGFLTDKPPIPSDFEASDIRGKMPRFQTDNHSHNLQIAERFSDFAKSQGHTRAQLALAWLLHQGEHVIPIPGTTSINHLEENFAATDIALSSEQLQHLDSLISEQIIKGKRYPEPVYAEIDSEEF
ncbi:aldo/keto reductase [Aurantivibrio plasticivorans]